MPDGAGEGVEEGLGWVGRVPPWRRRPPLDIARRTWSGILPLRYGRERKRRESFQQLSPQNTVDALTVYQGVPQRG